MNMTQLPETPGQIMVVAFEAPRHLVEQADRLAEADFLSRSALVAPHDRRAGR
jgi:hypothetical protein